MKQIKTPKAMIKALLRADDACMNAQVEMCRVREEIDKCVRVLELSLTTDNEKI